MGTYRVVLHQDVFYEVDVTVADEDYAFEAAIDKVASNHPILPDNPYVDRKYAMLEEADIPNSITEVV